MPMHEVAVIDKQLFSSNINKFIQKYKVLIIYKFTELKISHIKLKVNALNKYGATFSSKY